MTVLEEIVSRVRVSLQLSRQRVPEDEIRRQAADRASARDFAAALRRRADGMARIIAELKRASPSKGLIRRDFGVVSLARDLSANGAAALSVLTEARYFRGSPAFLRAAAACVEIPILRKDFIVDPYQVYEARAWGADAVLLIASALTPTEFRELHGLARDVGLAVLAEVHNADELEAVLDAGVEIVGVNSRDLKTFRTDLSATEALLERIPEGVVKVAESGIRGPEDVVRMSEAGADAFLVGEALMRAASPGEVLAELVHAPLRAGVAAVAE